MNSTTDYRLTSGSAIADILQEIADKLREVGWVPNTIIRLDLQVCDSLIPDAVQRDAVDRVAAAFGLTPAQGTHYEAEARIDMLSRLRVVTTAKPPIPDRRAALLEQLAKLDAELATLPKPVPAEAVAAAILTPDAPELPAEGEFTGPSRELLTEVANEDKQAEREHQHPGDDEDANPCYCLAPAAAEPHYQMGLTRKDANGQYSITCICGDAIGCVPVAEARQWFEDHAAAKQAEAEDLDDEPLIPAMRLDELEQICQDSRAAESAPVLRTPEDWTPRKHSPVAGFGGAMCQNCYDGTVERCEDLTCSCRCRAAQLDADEVSR